MLLSEIWNRESSLPSLSQPPATVGEAMTGVWIMEGIHGWHLRRWIKSQTNSPLRMKTLNQLMDTAWWQTDREINHLFNGSCHEAAVIVIDRADPLFEAPGNFRFHYLLKRIQSCSGLVVLAVENADWAAQNLAELKAKVIKTT